MTKEKLGGVRHDPVGTTVPSEVADDSRPLSPHIHWRSQLAAALEMARATLILKNCRLINVHSREIYETDITIVGDTIVSTDRRRHYDADQVVDCEGRFAAPGLIDPHMHVDTTFISPSELARLIVPLGTTTVFVDTTNISHTGGARAVMALMRAFEGLPLKAYIAAPSYCPFNASLETAAVDVTPADIAQMLEHGCVSIGETVWSKIALGDIDYLERIAATRARGKRVSGHGGEIPRGDAAAFDGYVAAGIQDDHCLSIGVDIAPRLRRGLKLFCVEASGRRGQLDRLLRHAIAERMPLRQMCFCIDNITVMDMVEEGYGYLDYLVKIALDIGTSPVDTFRMAALHAAEHYRVDDRIGSIAPGRVADILLLDTPGSFPPAKVIVNGRIVAEEGRLCIDVPPSSFPDAYRKTIKLDGLDKRRLAVAAPAGRERVKARVIKVIDGDAFNSTLTATLDVSHGLVQPDIANDILKIVVIERYGRGAGVGVGFVRGFGLRRGAIATSLSVPSNNIVAVGVSDDDIWTAIQHLHAIQGGFVTVADGEVLAQMLLPLGGIMAEQPYEEVVAQIQHTQAAARLLGCELIHPFFTMAQTVLSTLPDLGLTDKGLVNARTAQVVPVVIEEALQ